MNEAIPVTTEPQKKPETADTKLENPMIERDGALLTRTETTRRLQSFNAAIARWKQWQEVQSFGQSLSCCKTGFGNLFCGTNCTYDWNAMTETLPWNWLVHHGRVMSRDLGEHVRTGRLTIHSTNQCNGTGQVPAISTCYSCLYEYRGTMMLYWLASWSPWYTLS